MAQQQQTPPRPQVGRPYFPNLTLIVYAQSQKCRDLEKEFPQVGQWVNIMLVDPTSLPPNSSGQKVPTIVNAMSDMFDKVNVARTGMNKVRAMLRDVQNRYLRATGQSTLSPASPATPSVSPSTPLQPAFTTPAATHGHNKDCSGEESCGNSEEGGGGAGKPSSLSGSADSGFVQQGSAIVMSPERLREMNAEIAREMELAQKVSLNRPPAVQPKEPVSIALNSSSGM